MGETGKRTLLKWLRARRSRRGASRVAPFGSGLLLACLLVPRLSWAQVPTRLVYVRAPAAGDCPEQSALETAVAARLGYDPFSPWGDQTIIATISRSNGNLVARAELVDHDGIAQGSRQLQASRSDCGELVATLALAISITLDPTHVAPSESAASKVGEPSADHQNAGNQEPESASLPVAREPAKPMQPEATRSAPPKEKNLVLSKRSSTLALHAYAGAFGALALEPHATLGGRVGAGLRHAGLALWLAGESTRPTSQTATGIGEVRISLLSSELALCLDVKRPLSVCALTSLGRLRGQGEGVTEPKSESSFYAALGTRGLLTLPLGPVFALLGNADVSAVLTRPTFQLQGADVWRPSALAFGAGLGISGRFL